MQQKSFVILNQKYGTIVMINIISKTFQIVTCERFFSFAKIQENTYKCQYGIIYHLTTFQLDFENMTILK